MAKNLIGYCRQNTRLIEKSKALLCLSPKPYTCPLLSRFNRKIFLFIEEKLKFQFPGTLHDENDDNVENNVMDLSASGCCSWCHKQGPCCIEDSGGTTSNSNANGIPSRKTILRKKFCSERCFGLHRRAMFKKTKRCEWCHTPLANEATICEYLNLNFCG